MEIVLQGGGELLNHVKQRVAEMKLRNVRIIDRILSREEVAKLTGEADALLLPLKDFGRPYLGISSKLYEYQAVGKPIICCADGQPAEYVRETRSGVVVKPGDYEALAKAVLHLKNNSDLARELGNSGRRYVKDNLSIEKIGKEMMAVFNKVLRHP
jgi:glycosyltransferase involved in cell wall biosynthesis